MNIDITKFEKNGLYIGKNIDGSNFAFSVLKIYKNINNILVMKVRIIVDDDSSSYLRYQKDSIKVVKNGSEPFDCFTCTKRIKNESELLALII